LSDAGQMSLELLIFSPWKSKISFLKIHAVSLKKV